MFAMSGPPATAIAGRMALIERFASPYFDQGELAAALADSNLPTAEATMAARLPW